MLFVCICAASFTSWEKPFEEDSGSSFDPSVVLISLDHQVWDLALKSPEIIMLVYDYLCHLLAFQG